MKTLKKEITALPTTKAKRSVEERAVVDNAAIAAAVVGLIASLGLLIAAVEGKSRSRLGDSLFMLHLTVLVATIPVLNGLLIPVLLALNPLLASILAALTPLVAGLLVLGKISSTSLEWSKLLKDAISCQSVEQPLWYNRTNQPCAIVERAWNNLGSTPHQPPSRNLEGSTERILEMNYAYFDSILHSFSKCTVLQIP